MSKNRNIGLPATIVLLLVVSSLSYYSIDIEKESELSIAKNKKFSIVDFA